MNQRNGDSDWPTVTLILGVLAAVTYMVVQGHPEALWVVVLIILALLV